MTIATNCSIFFISTFSPTWMGVWWTTMLRRRTCPTSWHAFATGAAIATWALMDVDWIRQGSQTITKNVTWGSTI
ncbi:hypothetical protein DIPPA_14895 [Diplonema papillatum]|nr:hypothetical protein DIPPA_14895 [Diplonema papillatum]